MRQCGSAHEDTRGRHESLGEASRAAHFITLGRSTMRPNCAMRILSEKIHRSARRQVGILRREHYCA